MALLALSLAPAPLHAAQIDEKRAEAAAIISSLEDQARSIVALDKEHRRARDELAVADAAVARAESELAVASRRQDEARRMLAAHAQAAYVGGGSVTFLGRMARATVSDAGARRTYLRIAVGEDRNAIGRLQAAREDLRLRQDSLAEARKAAAGRSEATSDDLAQLEEAMADQRAVLTRVNGDLAQLVAAEQQRREAEEARASAALRAAASAAPAAASAAPAATPRAGAVTTAPPATTAPARAAAAPPPPSSDSQSMDETFACIRQLESGNNYNSPSGGAYQFQDATWQSLGYTGSAEDHPPHVQDEAARKLQARDGWGPWTVAPMCGKV